MLQTNQKPSLLKPTCMCKLKILRVQKTEISLVINSMHFGGTTEVGPGKTGVLNFEFKMRWNDSKKRMETVTLLWTWSCSSNFNMDKIHSEHHKTDQGGHLSRDIGSLITLAYCHIPVVRKHSCILCLKGRDKIFESKSLHFGLSTPSKTFTRATKPILLQCQKMVIT